MLTPDTSSSRQTAPSLLPKIPTPKGLPKIPAPKGIVWTQSRGAGGCTPDLSTLPPKASAFSQLAHLPAVPTRSAPLGQLLRPARPATRGPLPAQRAQGALAPRPRLRPPPARASAPPARVLAHPSPGPPPAAPPPPHPTPPSPGPQSAQPHPGRKAPRPRRGSRRAGASRPGANANGALPQRRGRQVAGRSRARAAPPGPSVSGGWGSGGGTSHPPAAGGGKRGTQGGSERGRGEGTSEGDNAARTRSPHYCRCVLPPPLAGESPPGPRLSPPMQLGMNAQRRLAYPEVKHPSASGIRIGAGPGSERLEKKL